MMEKGLTPDDQVKTINEIDNIVNDWVKNKQKGTQLPGKHLEAYGNIFAKFQFSITGFNEAVPESDLQNSLNEENKDISEQNRLQTWKRS